MLQVRCCVCSNKVVQHVIFQNETYCYGCIIKQIRSAITNVIFRGQLFRALGLTHCEECRHVPDEKARYLGG